MISVICYAEDECNISQTAALIRADFEFENVRSRFAERQKIIKQARKE
jgi:hypothetical protein